MRDLKLITFTVPCYNSEAYMSKCIESLLVAGSEAEIIIVNDGSSDRTAELADSFAEKFPDLIRVIHQENGGHGEGVNQGIRNASGLYFKVVDSDDWLDTKALLEFMAQLRHFVKEDRTPDLIVANYVFERVYENRSYTSKYKGALPVGRTITWDQIGHFGQTQYMAMHAMYYKTEVLRKSGVVLPKHTFYVDNLIAYSPLPYVKTLHYLDLDLYRYFIGREDQSVNESIMIKRIDQHLLVNELMMKSCHIDSLKSHKLRRYMHHYLIMLLTISSVFIMLMDEEDQEKRYALWHSLKEYDEKMYKKMSGTFLGSISQKKSRAARTATIGIYRVMRKIMKFN